MTQERSVRHLRDEVLAGGGSRPDRKTEHERCVLRAAPPCCQGRGYVVYPQGAFTASRLCDCVASCPVCYGKASFVEGGMARSCREPNPLTVAATINEANIPARYHDSALDRFSNFSGNGREVIDTVSLWLKQFARGASPGLLLGGPVGVGKTYVLAALTKGLAERGVSVRFVDFFQLLADLKAGFSANQAEQVLLGPLIDIEVLVIDELGKGKNTDFDLTVLDQLIDGRYRQRKPIVASTNYRLQDGQARQAYNVDLDRDGPAGGARGYALGEFETLERRVQERIYSRLTEMCRFIDLTGQDFRKQMRPGGLTPQGG